MSITIRHIAEPVRKEINLPASKSISNRVLIIQALCEKKFRIKNLSEADDTQYLLKALESKSKTIDAGEGGTTFRFLMSYLATQEGEWKLTGSKRLLARPVTPLIEALKKLGASIEKKSTHYLIKGKQLSGGKLSVSAKISSQFISALLLIAPTMKNELHLTLKGKIVSSPYIDMTVGQMREFGIDVTVKDKRLTVTPGKYQAKNFKVEADWSAASYFYELTALKPGSKMLLKGLLEDSSQGDRVVAEIYKAFAVKSSFTEAGVWIENEIPEYGERKTKPDTLVFDLIDCPDLFPALAVTVAVMGMHAVFKNTATLNEKESERANVFADIITQFGCIVKHTENIFFILQSAPDSLSLTSNLLFSSHNDHRVVMSLAPLASVLLSVTFDNETVVNKSFPGFWKEFKKKNS